MVHLWYLIGAEWRAQFHLREDLMAGKSKQIEADDLDFIKTYIGGRILNGSFVDLLVSPDQYNKIRKQFEQAAQDEDLIALNRWLDHDVTADARKAIWGAARSRAHRRKNPRSEHTISKKNAVAVLKWAGTDDIDKAVEMLLKAVAGTVANKH
jgi:hypothetical protein